MRISTILGVFLIAVVVAYVSVVPQVVQADDRAIGGGGSGCGAMCKTVLHSCMQFREGCSNSIFYTCPSGSSGFDCVFLYYPCFGVPNCNYIASVRCE